MTKFPNTSVSHKLDLFDKFIEHGSESMNETNLERVHTQLCKQILGVSNQTQQLCIR